MSRCLTYRVCFTHRVSRCFDTRETFSRCFTHEVHQTSGASLDLHHSRITPHTQEIRLQIMTTAKISTSFPGSTRTFPTRFHGSSRDFHGSKRESPSLKRVDRQENCPIWRRKYFTSDLLRERCHTSSVVCQRFASCVT